VNDTAEMRIKLQFNRPPTRHLDQTGPPG